MSIFGELVHFFGEVSAHFAWKLVSRTSKQVSRNLGLLWQPGVIMILAFLAHTPWKHLGFSRRLLGKYLEREDAQRPVHFCRGSLPSKVIEQEGLTQDTLDHDKGRKSACNYRAPSTPESRSSSPLRPNFIKKMSNLFSRSNSFCNSYTSTLHLARKRLQ